MRLVGDEIRSYLREWEAGTLDTIANWAERESTSACFYGRNTPRGRAGECDPQKVETWAVSGYGSTAAILDMAKRHGRKEVLAWVARNVRLAMDLVPWWLETFGKPPGEDARPPGICGETRESVVAAGGHGDSDIRRHWNSYGLLTAAVDPDLLGLGLWSKDEALALAESLLGWVESHRAGVMERPREYLRYGNDLDGLCGQVDVFDACGRKDLADRAYGLLAAYLRHVFAPRHRVTAVGHNGEPWHDWNYGEMERQGNACYEPFTYGWYPFGMQAWYRGHLLVALYHAAVVAGRRGDGGMIQIIVQVANAYTKWMDPTRRAHAPLAPETADGARWFHNSILQGGFVDPDRRILRLGEQDTGLSDWAALDEGRPFRRYAWHDTGVGGWKSDGGYWEEAYIDPAGDEHRRKHNSGGANLYKPQLPGLETANGYGCVDGIFFRALMFGDEALREFARIVLFQHLAYCHLSDTVVRLDQRLRKGVTEGANLVGKPGRAFHWAIQCGWIFRAAELKDGGADAAFPGISAES